MGDPRKLRKKYTKPSHPWQKQRIDEEAILMKEYGFKNKIELWRLNSLLRKYKLQVKKLVPRKDETAEKEKKNLLMKLFHLHLVKEDAIPEDILALTLKDLCERRLQTLVFRKSIARSIDQARQFITHEHILIGDKKITSPSYILNAQEEALLRVSDTSPMVSEDHPERGSLQKALKEEMHAIGLKERSEEEEIEKEKPKKGKARTAKEELKADVKREEAEIKEEAAEESGE
jgi:small subunit ribosomal protein S4